jgi:hypothetical protein
LNNYKRKNDDLGRESTLASIIQEPFVIIERVVCRRYYKKIKDIHKAIKM